MIIPKAAVTALAAQSKRPAKKASIDDDSNDDSHDDFIFPTKRPATKKYRIIEKKKPGGKLDTV